MRENKERKWEEMDRKAAENSVFACAGWIAKPWDSHGQQRLAGAAAGADKCKGNGAQGRNILLRLAVCGHKQ